MMINASASRVSRQRYIFKANRILSERVVNVRRACVILIARRKRSFASVDGLRVRSLFFVRLERVIRDRCDRFGLAAEGVGSASVGHCSREDEGCTKEDARTKQTRDTYNLLEVETRVLEIPEPSAWFKSTKRRDAPKYATANSPHRRRETKIKLRQLRKVRTTTTSVPPSLASLHNCVVSTLSATLRSIFSLDPTK